MKKPHGKQTIKQLIAQGAQLTNIQITDQNIKSFDRVARKYGIDYSLKKDSHVEPPLYLVFFKSKDVDVMTAAFKEYAGVELDQSKKNLLSERSYRRHRRGKQNIVRESRRSRKSEGRNDDPGKDAEYPDEESGDIKYSVSDHLLSCR